MFQDIAPHRFCIEFERLEARDEDFVFIYRSGQALLHIAGDHPAIPRLRDVGKTAPAPDLAYLFRINDQRFFLALRDLPQAPAAGLSWSDTRLFRDLKPAWMAFAGATAAHLAFWYENNRFCGKCAAPMLQSQTERALRCPPCNRTIYPSIAPVIMAAVVDGDRILLTRYANRPYKGPALVAGYIEAGETLEDAVRREVMEETGLSVKNIRYHKSQPWPFSQSILAGFFADLAGPDTIRLDTTELEHAAWTSRADLPIDPSPLSLTGDMIETFRNGGK